MTMYLTDHSPRSRGAAPRSTDRSTAILTKCLALRDAAKAIVPKIVPRKPARTAAEEAGRLGAAKAAAYAKWMEDRIAIYKKGVAR